MPLTLVALFPSKYSESNPKYKTIYELDVFSHMILAHINKQMI